MDIVDIIKDTKDFQNLCDEIKKQNISKSILLFSKDSLYVDMFSKLLAIAILSDGNITQNEHYFKIMANSHPDVKFYPQKDKLLVADSQEIVMESFIKPIFADKKIFIIKNIDISMESAQNKLLKVLEEPPENVYFIITCTNPNLLLPTIKSRCNKFELAKVDKSLVEKFLSQKQDVSLISSISDGLLGKALDISNKNNIKDIFELSLSIITKMKSSKVILNFSNKILTLKNEISLVLEILCLILEDLLYLKSGNDNLVRFIDYKVQLQDVLDDYSIKSICEIQTIINKALKEISFNGNMILIIENLLLNILEVKYICK